MAQEEIIDVDPIYKQGFEIGYWLGLGQKPEVDEFSKKATTPSYKAGLLAGHQEAEKEMFIAHLQKQKQATQGQKPRGPRPR